MIVVSNKTMQSKSRSNAPQPMIEKSVLEEMIPLETRRCGKKSKVEGTVYGTQDNSPACPIRKRSEVSIEVLYTTRLSALFGAGSDESTWTFQGSLSIGATLGHALRYILTNTTPCEHYIPSWCIDLIAPVRRALGLRGLRCNLEKPHDMPRHHVTSTQRCISAFQLSDVDMTL